MDGQVWSVILTLLHDKEQFLSRRLFYSNRAILEVILWAVLHDRPMVWACQPENWPARWRPKHLPHPSTISRRWRCREVQTKAQLLHQLAVSSLSSGNRYGAMDGRPLLVGGYSKDPDVRSGRGVGGMGKGYKMHAVVNTDRLIATYEIHPLSVAEQRVAVQLLKTCPPELTRMVADGNYDSMNLHRVAEQTGRRLYTPIRQNRVGQRQQARRLQLLRLWQHPVGQQLLSWRDEVERTFGQTSTIGFGFKGLPSWARRQHRVERWMWGKTLCYHAWLIYKRSAA